MRYEEYIYQLEIYDRKIVELEEKIKKLEEKSYDIELHEERLEEEYKEICEEKEFIEKAKMNAKLFSLKDMPFWLVSATCVLLLVNSLNFLPLRIFTIAILGTSVLSKVIEYANGKYHLKKFDVIVKELDDGKLEKNIDKHQELEKLFARTQSQKNELKEEKISILQEKSIFQNSYIKSVVDQTLVTDQLDNTLTSKPKQFVKRG